MVLNAMNAYFFISIFLIIYMISYFMQNSRAYYIKMLSCLFFMIFFYIFGYMMILNAKTIENIMFWNRMQYLGIPFISYFWLMIGVSYAGIHPKTKSIVTCLFAVIPVLTLIIRFTNSFHHMYYTSFEVYYKNGMNLLEIGKGIGYFIFQSYHLSVTIIIILIFFTVYLRSDGIERKKYGIFFTASILPAVSVVLNLTDPFNLDIDYSATLLPVVVLIISYGIIEYDFLEIKNLARNEIFYSSEFSIIILSRSMEIMDFNNRTQEFFELLGIEITHDKLEQINDKNQQIYKALKQFDRQLFQYEIGDELKTWEIDTHPIKNKFNSNLVYGYVKYIRDITDLAKNQELLEYLAKTDELSELNNRREFIARAERILDASQKNGQTISIMTMDIDDFKSVNDNFGHHVGDVVIRNVSIIIKNNIGKNDIAGRLGGEEFTVLLPNADGTRAFERAEILRKKINESRFIESHPDRIVTVSIGISQSGKNENLDSMLIRADKAMYSSKRNGKNQTTLFAND